MVLGLISALKSEHITSAKGNVCKHTYLISTTKVLRICDTAAGRYVSGKLIAWKSISSWLSLNLQKDKVQHCMD